jgi:hypothetical protein
MCKNSRSGSGMNFRKLRTNFGLKMLEFFDADPGSEIFFSPGSGIRDKHPRFAALLKVI